MEVPVHIIIMFALAASFALGASIAQRLDERRRDRNYQQYKNGCKK